MAKINLVFGSINTIPVGCRDSEAEELYQAALKPFLGALYRQPQLNATCYYSGTMLSWLERFHPEYNDVLAEMVGRKQIEVLGGAFHDPVLGIIPRSDRIGQIESLTTLLRKRLGRKPRGFWIPEGEWDPSLPFILRTILFDYTFLSEEHFSGAGFEGGEALEPVVTEDQGKTLAVLPIHSALVDDFCDGSAKAAVDRLQAMTAGREESLAVMLFEARCRRMSEASDKLERFIQAVNAVDGLECVHPSRYLKSNPPRVKAFFPAGLMGEHILHSYSPERQKRLLAAGRTQKGGESAPAGSFKRFFTRYEESNLLYGKMQYTHILVNQLRRDKYRKSSAREELWKGQCHSAYWHGPGGGFYDNHLRKSAYRCLINAEKLTREKGVFFPSIVPYDLDLDGREEYLYQGNELNVYVHTRGAQIFELDDLGAAWNYLDTCRRYEEPYHDRGTLSAGIDACPRRTLMDRFFARQPGLEELADAADAGNFVDGLFEVVKYDREHSELVLARTGSVKSGRNLFAIQVLKKFIFKRSAINLYYTVKNVDDRPWSGVFSTELNFSFSSRTVDGLRLFALESNKRAEFDTGSLDLGQRNELLLSDVKNDVAISLSTLEAARVFSQPVETVSRSNRELVKTYQSSSLQYFWELKLEPQAMWENRFTIRLD